MINRVRSAHTFAALFLLAAACGDSGGGGKDKDKDTGVEEEDATVEEDAGEEEDATVEEDAGDETPDGAVDPTDGAVDPDGSTDGALADTGAGNPDAGTDSGPTLPANCAEAAIVAATGGSVTSSDSRFQLTLAASELSWDSTVRVCTIAAASAPAGLTGRVGDAYEITTTQAATFSGRATFTGHAALPLVDATAAFDPPTVRSLPTGGAVANGTGAVLSMSKRALAADTVTRLSAAISGPGHIYVAPLEAPGVYHVDMRTPKTSYVTGEVIDLSTIVTVTGAPAGTRTLEAEVNGCDLDPISYTNPAGVVTQPGPVTNNASCIGGNYVAVARRGGPTGNIMGGSAVGGAALSGGATFDLRDYDNTPLGLYCRFPGAGKGAARLFFKTGATTDLEVRKDVEVTCTYSGDLIAIYDQVPITRGGANDFVVGTTYTPLSYAAISPPGITYTTVAPDAVTFAEPAAVLSSAGTTSFNVDADYMTGPDATPTVTATNAVAFTYATDRYTPAYTNATGFFQFLPRAALHVRVGGNLAFDCYPPSAADLGLRLGGRSGASSTVSILDGSIDLISIRATVPGSGPATIVQRLVDASKLARYQAVPLLTAAQQSAVAGTPSQYAVGFYRVAWDEKRRIWDGGRVLPVACGTVLLFEAADVAP